MVRHIGVDLHSNSLTACYWSTEQAEQLQTFPLKELAQFQAGLQATDEIAVEATGNVRWFVEQIKALVARVVVVNPRQFGVIRQSVKKTDRHDARALAQFLSKDLLPESRLKDKAAAQLESLCQTRQKFVQLRTTCINKIHALHRARGIESKKSEFSSAKGLEAVRQRAWDVLERVELEVRIEQIQSLDTGIKKLEKQLIESGQELAGYENLTSIKGIGEKSAVILLSVIGDVNDFADEDKLTSYFGIAPRVSNSNETVQHGKITKRGSKLGRTTLVQCTLVAIKYSAYLKRFYEKKKSQKGAGKAIIATARKFLGIIYRTLKQKWVFADFPNFVLVEG
jgi:transposase